MTSPQILLSRRVLRQIKPKYPTHFSPPKSSSSSNTSSAETPWPKWMQFAGYGAVAIAIPYTIGVVISESRDLRDYLEGDSGGNTGAGAGAGGGEEVTMGRKIVGWVRWYWGEEDDIPYIEYLERKSNDNHHSEASIGNEAKTIWRLNQDRIEQACDSDVTVSIECDGMMKDDVAFKGNLPLGEQLLAANGTISADSKNVFVSFQDETDAIADNNSNAEGNTLNDLLDGMDGNISQEDESSPVKEIGNLSTTYSTWNYFPPQNDTNVSPTIGTTKSSSSFDTTQLRIDELQYNIDEIQKSLFDPSCTRDRDDMEAEMRQMRLEIGTLKRERRVAKLKKFLPF